MKSPPHQIHDDIAFNRVEAFIRGDDNETLVGTETPEKRKLRRMAGSRQAGRRSRPPRGDDRRRPAAGRPAGSRTAARGPPPPGGEGPRVVERAALAGYRASRGCSPDGPPPASTLIGFARALVPGLADETALVEPNFGHVLGSRRTSPGSARLALRAYYGYGRYLVELMRLPTDSPEERAAMVPDLDVVEFKRLWRESPNGGGMIFVVGHVGSNDAVAAAIARHEMPISVLADDSAFPELFELLRRQREAWGVHDHRAGATCARSSACSAGARCSVCSWTGATARTGSR